MLEFSEKLEQHFLGDYPDDATSGILYPVVGEGSDPTHVVNYFDDHLHGFDLDEVDPWPFLVVTARSAEQTTQGEIAQPSRDLRTWSVNIYYLDLVEDYKLGKQRRSNIIARLDRYLEADRRLNNFSVTDITGTTEYVYDLEITNVLLDYSGHEDYHTFTCEMYLNVYTAKS